jgi:hypothetical protein
VPLAAFRFRPQARPPRCSSVTVSDCPASLYYAYAPVLVTQGPLHFSKSKHRAPLSLPHPFNLSRAVYIPKLGWMTGRPRQRHSGEASPVQQQQHRLCKRSQCTLSGGILPRALAASPMGCPSWATSRPVLVTQGLLHCPTRMCKATSSSQRRAATAAPPLLQPTAQARVYFLPNSTIHPQSRWRSVSCFD